jgi:catechol 2,3-dioxygenase-like lactoylglutathione lyase family enzyme
MVFTANPDFRLHHVGIVVRGIAEFRSFYVDVLQYRERTPVIHDPIQTAFVQFFSIQGADHYIELVAPDGESSKLQEACRKGKTLNHLCYSCGNIAAMISFMKESGCFVIQKPVPAVAFEGRLIAWLMTQDGLLVELVERGLEGSL